MHRPHWVPLQHVLYMHVNMRVFPEGLKVHAVLMEGWFCSHLPRLQFRAPHTLVYDTFRADGSRSKLLSYGVPTKPGE